MSIVPDDKDWTWVLERPCPECGFDAGRIDRDAIPRLLRDNVAAWPAVVDHPQVRARPAPDRWSALEYACHVRDVFRLFDHRLRRMLNEHAPLFSTWDQDATALEDHYREQDPAVVIAHLVAAGTALADRLGTVKDDSWARPGFRSDGAAFTVESFSHYLLHDPVHHLDDVRRGNAALDAAGGT